MKEQIEKYYKLPKTLTEKNVTKWIADGRNRFLWPTSNMRPNSYQIDSYEPHQAHVPIRR